jgi:hypothetical protein
MNNEIISFVKDLPKEKLTSEFLDEEVRRLGLKRAKALEEEVIINCYDRNLCLSIGADYVRMGEKDYNRIYLATIYSVVWAKLDTLDSNNNIYNNIIPELKSQ